MYFVVDGRKVVLPMPEDRVALVSAGKTKHANISSKSNNSFIEQDDVFQV